MQTAVPVTPSTPMRSHGGAETSPLIPVGPEGSIMRPLEGFGVVVENGEIVPSNESGATACDSNHNRHPLHYHRRDTKLIIVTPFTITAAIRSL